MPDSNLIRKEKRSIQTEAWSWVKCILCGIVIALALDFLVIANARVPTGSMEDTIPVGARIIGLRHSYLFEEPQRGDIIIFKYPDDESVHYVKRVIGLPGETVIIADGNVYVDRKLIDEPYIKEKTHTSEAYINSLIKSGDYSKDNPIVIQPGYVWCMGDNRNNSVDSRFDIIGNVTRKEIIGRAVFRLFPFKNFGPID